MKKILLSILSIIIVVGTICFIPNEITKVNATTITKNINLGTHGITSPTVGGGPTGNWEGSKIYFGTETDKNLWRVLDSTTGLLFADETVDTQQFSVSNNIWDSSPLKTWLNDNNYKLNSTKFTTTEQALIKSDFTLLTVSEAQNINYGFTGNTNDSNTRSTSNTKGWWTSSPGNANNMIAFVSNTGAINTNGTRFYETNGVRPAFLLDMNAIHFTTAAAQSKSDFALVDDNYANDNTWKLTLKDGDTAFSTATLPATASIGENIKINVSAMGSGTYNQTSAMLVDGSNNVVAYGKIGDASIGEKTFTIPTAAVAGNYTLRVFQEQVNGQTSSDYVSKEITTPITLANPTRSVNIVAGAHMTKTSTSGEAIQNGLTGAMNTVVYTADNDYYFPIDYSLDSKNGITVTRDNFTQITISGTPAANTSITLNAATAKSKPTAPTNITSSNNNLLGTTIDMEYSSDPNADTWTSCTDENTSVQSGTWYIRYKATDTTKASDFIQIIVNNPITPSITSTLRVTNGLGSGTYIVNETVSITANKAPEGKVFKQWIVTSGNITLKDPSSETTTFTMPNEEVEVEATYQVNTPNQGQGNSTTPRAPQTGDNSLITCLLTLISISGLVILCINRKRQYQQNK